MKSVISIDQARLFRLRTNQLADRNASNPEELLKHIVGVQAQEITAGMLSMRARIQHMTIEQIDQTRQTDHDIIWGWFMRGTLHLVSSSDALWLIPLLGPTRIALGMFRLRQLGWDETSTGKASNLIQNSLQEQGFLTHAQIRSLLKFHHFPFEGQAPVHLLYHMSFKGLICRGADDGSHHTYTLLEDWLGKLRPLPTEEGLARLAERYLTAYAPASLKDFITWSGIQANDAQTAWKSIEEMTDEVMVSGETYRVLKTQSGWLDQDLPQKTIVNLLPRFDTFLLGYSNRDLIIEPSRLPRYNAGGGIAHAVVLVNGHVKGTWRLSKTRKSLQLLVDPFEPLSTVVKEGIAAEAADITRFLGKTVGLSFLESTD